jgi:uncharacterized protein YxjI
MSTSSAAPGWYPDPFGRHEHRWFDGGQWTDQVASYGRQSTDPPVAAHVPTAVVRDAAKTARDVGKAGAAGVASWQGGGHLLNEPVLVVSQKAKLIEVNNEYGVFGADGRQLGMVRQVGQSTAKKVLRVLTSVDQFMTHKLQVCDAGGNVVLALTRPAKVFKSRIVVEDGAGRPVGEVVQENMVGKIRFGLLVGGQKVGSINGENWRAWNFNIQDHAGQEVARITKTWEGVARTLFTTADNYVVQVHRPLEEPLRSLVVAAALCVDTALKQDQRGFG